MNKTTNNDDLQAMITQLVNENNWESIYKISSLLCREVSILIDADSRIFVDWGSRSEVALNPPTGAKIPFKLWVHTHPNMPAYWSLTDRESLMIASGILVSAYVLGINGLLFTKYDLTNQVKKLVGMDWTDESVTPWNQVSEGLL